MLPKKKRITKEIFQDILKKGTTISSPFFIFKYIKKENKGIFAFVVSKKLVKTATKRNFLRRSGYNILRLYSLNSYAGIFFYKKEGLNRTKPEIKEDIEFLLKKANFI